MKQRICRRAELLDAGRSKEGSDEEAAEGVQEVAMVCKKKFEVVFLFDGNDFYDHVLTCTLKDAKRIAGSPKLWRKYGADEVGILDRDKDDFVHFRARPRKRRAKRRA